jgi:branched-chain amino acid transport system ATP-binding protein
MSAPLLSVEGLTAGYGAAQVLFGIDFAVGEGEVVTLLGRNGMGKTTTIRAVMGLIRPWQGRVRVRGVDLTGARPHRIAQAGLGLVPEGRQVFPTLSVEENLLATAKTPAGRARWDRERVYDFFPGLGERRSNLGAQLSGGEQQMLAIGRALMTNPRLVVLDEATEGLAPLVREEIWACLDAIRRTGTAILIIDKNVDRLAKLADRHVVIEKGRVVWTGTSTDLANTPEVKDDYLHV